MAEKGWNWALGCFRFHSQEWGLHIWLWRHELLFLLPGPWVGWTGPWPWLERLELKIWPYTNFLRHRYECLPSGPCAAGLLTDHRWEELGPSVVPFQNLLSCRHECFPWGPGTPGLLADYQCEESGTVYKAPSWFLGVQMGISPAWSLCQKTCS